METLTIETLPKEELILYQELFSVFDKEDNGTMPTQQFPMFVRGLGHCPTQRQLKQMKNELDPNNQGYVCFNTIVSLLLKRQKEQNIEDQLLEAFEGIQSETGSLSDGEKTYKMSVKEAKKFLIDFGETFSENEAEKFQQFLEENNLKEGIQFNYHDLVKIMAFSYQS